MKIILLFTIVFLINFNSFSQQVSISDANVVAKNFIAKNTELDINQIDFTNPFLYKKDSMDFYYIFNFINKKGFVLVASDKRVYPVLAYSTESNYNLNDSLSNHKAWMENYSKAITSVYKNTLKQASYKNDTVERIIQNAWNEYLTNNTSIYSLKSIQATVGPLVKATWGQGMYYNFNCPLDPAGPGGHVMVGCVAVSEAQILKYWSYPSTGVGSHSYVFSTYGNLFADFGNTIYDYSKMPDLPKDTFPELNKLMYHCGVSVDMMYGAEASSSWISLTRNAFVNYFKYSSNASMEYRSNYTDGNWVNMLKKELDAGRPMVYAGHGSDGHAFICDGYQNVAQYLHFDWGWSGSYNGFYMINNMVPNGYSFNESHEAIVGIEPIPVFKNIDCSLAQPLASGTIINGNTSLGVSYINKYGNSFHHTTGKELVYKITLSHTDSLKIELSNCDSKLNVFLLSSNHFDSLVGYSSNSIVIPKAKLGNYYIVVDGDYGYSGTFSLKVTYPNADCNLFSSNLQLYPNPINLESSQLNISTKIINTGKSSLSKTTLSVFLSKSTSPDVYYSILTDSILNITAYDTIDYFKSFLLADTLMAGNYYLFVSLDNINAITEGDESDNFASRLVKIIEPNTLKDQFTNDDIKMFPVPAISLITVQSVKEQIQFIIIYDQKGSKLIEKKCSGFTEYISVLQLHAGIYTVKIKTEFSEYIRKINILR